MIPSTSMEALIEILEETPWWVYLLFFYLLSMGIKARKPQTVSIKKLVIFPAILTLWGLASMTWSPIFILGWTVSLAIGVGLGWFFVRKWKVRYDRKRGTLHLPGSPSTLVLALVFFSIKYFFGFYHATQFDLSIEMRALESGVTGIIAGIFIGRLAFFLKRYEKV